MTKILHLELLLQEQHLVMTMIQGDASFISLFDERIEVKCMKTSGIRKENEQDKREAVGCLEGHLKH